MKRIVFKKWFRRRKSRSTDAAQDLLVLDEGGEHEVHCNNLELNSQFGYPNNRTWTTKYTWYTFVPRSLFEQYRRAAYWYFTAMAGISLTPIGPYQPVTVIVPLVFVLLVGMARELWEDVRRARGDKEINGRVVTCCTRGIVHKKLSRELEVGDIVKIKDKEYFPADLVLLQSSNPDGICYVETKNLDGETNLKVRQASQATSHLVAVESFKEFEAVIRCEPPNASLYMFNGSLEFPDGQVHPLALAQVLLRDSSLQNTDYVLAVVVYAGPDTKVMRNAIDPPSKRSRIDQSLDKIMLVMFAILFLMSFATGLAGGILVSDRVSELYYLQPGDDDPYFNPRRAGVAGIIAFVTGLVLYGYLIPIALYVTLEIVRVVQALFIGQDLGMYDEENDRPAKVKTSGLNEELGQVNTILSDKTGTLTANQMDFCKCTIDGVSYGMGATDVERAAKQREMYLQDAGIEDEDEREISNGGSSSGNVVKGFNFEDPRLMNRGWLSQANADRMKLFFRTLALCHTAIPEGEIPEVSYRAESPDETALVVAAQQFGFVFFKKTSTHLLVNEVTGRTECSDRAYELLNVLEFSSARRRMSVIVKFPEGNIMLLSKGADSVMLERLNRRDEVLRANTLDHLRIYAEAGLRTLVFGCRELQPDEYQEWQTRFTDAQNVIGGKREELLEIVQDEIERDLELLGGTGVEDKLQEGVPKCIERLAQAGIKIWVLTGDKVETAINIGYACNLLRPGMEKVIVNLRSSAVQMIDEKLSQGGFSPEERARRRKDDLQAMVRQQLDDALRAFESDIEMEQFPRKMDSPSSVPSSEASASGRLSDANIEHSGSLRSSGSRGLQRTMSRSRGSYLRMDQTKKSYALVIDGDSLAVVLAEDLQKPFLELATKCASVLCCRVSPKQKALIAKLVKKGLGADKLCLAIGDGANDVGMIQVANVGVGIIGVEGAQAAMAADYAIGKFRFLERLLLVHGHWSYRRISVLIRYFLFKVCLIGWISFYSNVYSLFSGTPLYDGWYASFYSTLFTALPVGVVGTIDQDVSAEDCIRYPQLYQAGHRKQYFNPKLITLSILHSLYASLLVFFFPVALYGVSALNSAGHPAALQDFGAALFTGLVIVPNLQLYTYVHYFTWIHHAIIWGSILSWFIFLIVYGALPPLYSTQGFREFVEVLAPSPTYWLLQLLVVVGAMLPDILLRSFQWVVRPADYQMVLGLARFKRRTTSTTPAPTLV